MRALQLAITAVFSALLAGGGFALTAWLHAFAPCRVPYRISDAAYGSLACQAYYTIGMFSAVLAFAACGLAAIAGILFFVRRRTER